MSGILARWTTPSISYKPSQCEVANIKEIFLTLKQRGVTKIIKSIDDAGTSEDSFTWQFSQEETGVLSKNTAIVAQIDYVTLTNQRYTVMPITLSPMDSAVDGVIS